MAMNTPARNQRRGRKKLSGAAALNTVSGDGWHVGQVAGMGRPAYQGPYDRGIPGPSPTSIVEWAFEQAVRRLA